MEENNLPIFDTLCDNLSHISYFNLYDFEHLFPLKPYPLTYLTGIFAYKIKNIY